MYNLPHQMEPLLPQKTGELEDLAREVLSRSAALSGSLHPVSQQAIVELTRIINSYYSNRIEGHSTHPVDIERAMRQDYSSEPAKRELQIESRCHIECQRAIAARLASEPDLDIAGWEFLSWVHRIFYEELPAELRVVKDGATGDVVPVIPGELRTRPVEVGRHLAPDANSLPAFLDRFASVYRRECHHGLHPIIAIAASHHRLMWIHPFTDGNGRVARLYTDACFARVPVLGYGLWNVSRGLARQRDGYMDALAHADTPRQGDYDGRGNLSDRALARFCLFFLTVCLDQIDYMGEVLGLPGLLERIRGYVEMRKAKLLPPPTNTSGHGLKSEAAYMLEHVLLHGEANRGDLVRVSGLAERTARNVLRQLLDEGLLRSDSPKGPVRFVIPAAVGRHFFTDLYPPEDSAGP